MSALVESGRIIMATDRGPIENLNSILMIACGGCSVGAELRSHDLCIYLPARIFFFYAQRILSQTIPLSILLHSRRKLFPAN
ncbi:hypothetical protein L1887_30220 [Cichorium endivia]|nr:hypothetical protein L1887_30220 [Cichorium endivia]